MAKIWRIVSCAFSGFIALVLTMLGQSREGSGAKKVRQIGVSVGWPFFSVGRGFDLDVSAFLLTEENVVRTCEDLVFVGGSKSLAGAVQFCGHVRPAEDMSSGKTELPKLTVDLRNVPDAIVKIMVTVSRPRNDWHTCPIIFGKGKAYVTFINRANNTEISRCEFDPQGILSYDRCLIVGELYRDGLDDWKLRSVGEDYPGGLAEMANSVGVAGIMPQKSVCS